MSPEFGLSCGKSMLKILIAGVLVFQVEGVIV